jgi:hypothetical protein
MEAQREARAIENVLKAARRATEDLRRPTTSMKVLRRELLIGQDPYTLTLSEEGFSLVLKSRRKGLEIRWAELVSADAALATALNASLRASGRRLKGCTRQSPTEGRRT